MKLWPHGLVRPIRFHHLRHTTASLLMMAGANPAAVQRIMRHTDPRLTTEVYGHLAPGYLRSEIDRLHLAPPPPESPRFAVAIETTPVLATDLLQTDLFQASGGSAVIAQALVVATKKRVGARGFEPPTFCSQNFEEGSPAGGRGLQPADIATKSAPPAVQPYQPSVGNPEDFTTRLLPTSGRRKMRLSPRRWPQAENPEWMLPWKARRVATTPTLADLGALYGGRGRLLTVAEVSEQLGVSTATVYKIVKRGKLPHVRVVDSIRVRPADLVAFIGRDFGNEPGPTGR